jgi:hypothetical protein
MSSRATRSGALALALIAASSFAGAAPDILTRAEWGARAPVMEMERNEPARLTIHHTATAPSPGRSLAEKLVSLQRFSQSEERLADGRLKVAWADIPYHFYIDVNGNVGEGREAAFIGDTNTDYDLHGHIGIVLEGNFEEAPPAPVQVEALVGLLASLAEEHGIPPGEIGGHRDYGQTLCPGKHLAALIPDIRRDVARALAR